MSTRKIRAKKDEIQAGAASRQSKDNNTNTRTAAVAGASRTKKKVTSKGKEKATGRRKTTADPEAQVKPSRRGISGKKIKGIESKEYRQKSPKASRSNWEDPTEQIHTHNPGRIYNEENTRGLGVRKTEQSARNISGERFYDQGSGAFDESHRYRTNQGSSQYPPYDREGYQGEPEPFRDEFNYNDTYWWEGQFPQGASWEGDGRWQHHNRDWTHRQNQQGERSHLPYGGDYEKYRWLQSRNRSQHSDDFNSGRSRGNMTWGEAMYPGEQRLREDIYQDPGGNFDEDNSGYRQAYYGGTDIGRIPRQVEWDENENRMSGGSHFHRDDRDWDNWDAKRRDREEFSAHDAREQRNDDDYHSQRGWTARDEYRRNTNENYNEDRAPGNRRDDEYHSRSTDMGDRIMDYLEESEDTGNRHMRTVWSNTLDVPYEGGYNTRTAQTDRRIGTGGYNQGGYGAQGYSQEYGNAGGYGSTGAYQTGHRGEHRRGDYHEGFRYASRQDEMKSRKEPRDYDRNYIVGSDDDMYRDVQHDYRARMNEDYKDDVGQFEGNVHGMKKYGEGEGNKWKNLGKAQHRR